MGGASASYDDKTDTKTLGMQGGKDSHVATWQCGTTENVLACLDIRTVFDEARPRHVAKIMGSHSTHGWIISALLRKVAGLKGQAMFECVESRFLFNRCLRQGSVEAPRLWQKMST